MKRFKEGWELRIEYAEFAQKCRPKNRVSGASEMHGKAAGVAGAISGESRMKRICEICAEHHSNVFDDTEHAEAQVLGKQLLRSGTSVGANYREAYRGAARRNGASGASDIDGNAAR